MPPREYWIRTIRALAQPGRPVALMFLTGPGAAKTWRGELAGLDDPRGPLVIVRGERRRLCPWEDLAAVEVMESDSDWRIPSRTGA